MPNTKTAQSAPETRDPLTSPSHGDMFTVAQVPAVVLKVSNDEGVNGNSVYYNDADGATRSLRLAFWQQMAEQGQIVLVRAMPDPEPADTPVVREQLDPRKLYSRPDEPPSDDDKPDTTTPAPAAAAAKAEPARANDKDKDDEPKRKSFLSR